jgi:hypothetical protein
LPIIKVGQIKVKQKQKIKNKTHGILPEAKRTKIKALTLVKTLSRKATLKQTKRHGQENNSQGIRTF